MRGKTISWILFVTFAMSLADAAWANESYFENFDSFEDGSNIIGQGYWIGWADDPNPDYGAPTSGDYALSDENSLEIGGDDALNWTDVVWQFPEANSGRVTFRAMTYIPFESDSFTNPAINFMVSHPTPLTWGGEMRFFLDRGEVDFAGNAANPVPMVRDEWVEVRLHVDLDTGQASMFYNDEPLGDFRWNGIDFIAVDLWAPAGTSPMYYDDLSLVPDEICDNDFDDDDDGLTDCEDDECPPCPSSGFVRGDPNSSGTIDLTDGIQILNFLFLGGPAPTCADSGDADDDGAIALTDAVLVFGFLFLGGDSPAPPSPAGTVPLAEECGPDPTDDDPLDCADPGLICS
jgi:hypothetical protein